MQGAFPGGVDWTGALDPGPDEQAQAVQRSDQIERELQRLTRLRNPQAAAAQPPDLLAYNEVYAPTPHFKMQDMTFYILKLSGMTQTRARGGVLGHYLVTTVDIVAEAGYCRPIESKQELPRNSRTPLPDPNILNPPGYSTNDPRMKPSTRFCMPFVHYTYPNQANPTYYEIGLDILKDTLEKAEALDLAFARRMEGLGYVSAQTCWDCLDPDYDPSDRAPVMEQFMGKYLGRFYDGVDPHGGVPTSELVDEAVRKHKLFCQSWVKKHYKTLTPAVTAPAEALASEFFPYIESWIPPDLNLTREEFARILMRLPDMAADFASCLHFYSTSLEQARGGRNASYKQMSVVSTYRALSHKRFGDLLANKATLLRRVFAQLAEDLHERHFSQLVVDWHAILGQMPQVHRLFQNASVVQGLLTTSRRNGNDAAHVPPWRTMRNTN